MTDDTNILTESILHALVSVLLDESKKAAQIAYKQGVEDALFRPEEHTEDELAARNMRLREIHKIENTKE